MRTGVISGMLIWAALFAVGEAVAAPPANDQFASATAVTSLPFTDSVDITEATRTFEEPVHGCYGSPQHTVWYRLEALTAATIAVRAASSAIPDVSIGVFQDGGGGVQSLRFVGCGSGPSPQVTFPSTAGTTYYVQLGNSFSAGGMVDVSITLVSPPANDDIAPAQPVALPLSATVDMTAATLEPGEPTPSCFSAAGTSVWYAVTPQIDTSVTVTVGAPDVTTTAVFVGEPVAGLTEIACRAYSGPLTFRAAAGVRSYVRVAAFGSVNVDVRIERAVDPLADFSWFPDPLSMFDTASFYNGSSDPGGSPWRSFTWDFGDGSPIQECCVTHRFPADGDYPVKLTVETLDGRRATATKVVPVRTHDVALRRFSLPKSAKSGRTISVSVDVLNTRYDEVVQVQLFRSRPSVFGDPYELIETLERPVAVRRRSATTFSFAYTVRNEDADAGKVSFLAIAWILGQSDALAADNRLNSPIVNVSR